MFSFWRILEWSKAITSRYYCCLSSCFCWSVWLCLLSLPAAPGYENLCGHRLRHSAGPPAAQGHHRARARHWRRHQAIQQVCEAGLWAVHWADHEAGWYCCAERWDSGTSSLLEKHLTTTFRRTVDCRERTNNMSLFSPLRWWEYGGYWSDSAACSQPAGGGE